MRGKLVLAAVVLLAVAGWFYMKPAGEDRMHASPSSDAPQMVSVTMPELTGEASEGGDVFNRFCATCHGATAGGVEGMGPPLIHKIYEPGHHGDFAFVRAAKLGVRSHHWRFGDMPPVEGITDNEIEAVIAYIRAIQRENGIF